MVRLLSITLVALFIALLVVFALRDGPANPWEPSGRVVLVARAVPSPGVDESRTFGIGVDNVHLTSVNGDDEQVSIRVRRILLSHDSTAHTVLLETRVPVGAYNGINMTLRSPEIRDHPESEQTAAAVVLQNEAISLNVPYNVREEETTVIILGIETFQALHVQNNALVYLPVIQTETRSDATVLRTTDDTVKIEGGVITASATYGMDWTGVMRLNYRAPSSPDTGTDAERERSDASSPFSADSPLDVREATTTL